MLYLPLLNPRCGASPDRDDQSGSSSTVDTEQVDAEQQVRRLPLTDATACGVERALLAESDDQRIRALAAAIDADQNLAQWTAKAAQAICGETFSGSAQAGQWLSQNLLALWTGCLEETEDVQGESSGSNLPQLLVRLHRLEQLENDFARQLEHEKLEAMKELAYGAGHEINNPLANISLRAQTLLKEETDPQRRRALSAINAQSYRAHEMIADLMLVARPPKIEPAPLELGAFVTDLSRGFASRLDERSIELIVQTPGTPVMAQADEKQLAVALSALCKNSAEAIGVEGHLIVSARVASTCSARESNSHSLDCPWAEITVRDDGPGIAPEALPKMFDPFYSGREAGRGLGFGLSKCWRIITDHGGHIDVESGPGRGALFTLHLPLAS